jgi:TrmH family RNA methyltransferase
LEPAHLTKPEVKALLALAQRQGGKAQKELFLEGPKIIMEALQSDWSPLLVVVSTNRSAEVLEILSRLPREVLVRTASFSEMERISRLKSPPSVMASFEVPEWFKLHERRSGGVPYQGQQLAPWWIVADRIQDPGNLGTMIRIADWFGFEGLICSPDTVDCFNAKVIQASMGSLFRVPVHYTDLNPAALFRLIGMKFPEYSSTIREQVAHDEAQDGPWVLASMPGGMDLNRLQFPKQGGILLVGNESQGLSQNVLDLATHRVGIPSFGSAESLNAAVATGIFANAIRQAEAIESEGS